MDVVLQHNMAMVEVECDLDYVSHQSSDRENGLIKVKEEKDDLSSAYLEWDTDEEVSPVFTSPYSDSEVCNAFIRPD
jgi:hypothetical protein